MTRLIDADALAYEILSKYGADGGTEDVNTIYEMIIDAPTVDAVEVVRCKECDSYVEVAWWFDDEGKKKECHCCVAHSIPVQPNDYCSYGERREP